MNIDFRTHLDRVEFQDDPRRGKNITLKRDPDPVIRFHEQTKGSHSIDDPKLSDVLFGKEKPCK
jgi:hypothetical protein